MNSCHGLRSAHFVGRSSANGHPATAERPRRNLMRPGESFHKASNLDRLIPPKRVDDETATAPAWRPSSLVRQGLALLRFFLRSVSLLEILQVALQRLIESQLEMP